MSSDRKEKLAEYNSKWSRENREMRKAYFIEKVVCDCGCLISRGSKCQHLKSNKHKKLMNIKNSGIKYEDDNPIMIRNRYFNVVD